MKTGLYIGRFQPFHLGHLSIVKRALEKVDHLVIGIGSAQYHDTEENPFSAEERKKIIELSLEEAKIDTEKYKIKSIRDIHDNERWPTHVQKTAGKFDVVFVGDNGIVKELFEIHTDIPIIELEETIFVRGTRIRKLIAEEGSWQKWLSPAAIKYIEEIKGVEKVMELNKIN